MSRLYSAAVLALVLTFAPSAFGLTTTLTQHGIVVDVGKGGQFTLDTIRIAAPNAPPAKTAPAANVAAAQSAPLAVQLGDKEISISASTAGTFSLAYPALVTGGEKRTSPVRIGKDADGVTLVYAAGGKGRVRLDGTTLRIAFSDLPAEVKQVRMEMLIPINFAGSGTYSIGGAAARRSRPKNRPSRFFTRAMPTGWKSYTPRVPASPSSFRLIRSSSFKTIASGTGAFTTGGSPAPCPKATAIRSSSSRSIGRARPGRFGRWSIASANW